MNPLNWKRAVHYGASFRDPTGSSAYEVIGALGRPYGFSKHSRPLESDQFTPETSTLADPAAREFRERHSSLIHANRALMALLRLDQAHAVTTADRSLSPEGQQGKLREPRAAAAKALAREWGALKAQRAEHGRRSVELYAIPSIGAGDLESIMVDQELRSWWRGLSEGERTPLFESLHKGTDDRLLLAMSRSPVPVQHSELLRDAWRGAVERREPEKAAALAADGTDIDWSTNVTSAAARYAARLLPSNRFELYQAARGSDGADIFNFQPHEASDFERRIAITAKAA